MCFSHNMIAKKVYLKIGCQENRRISKEEVELKITKKQFYSINPEVENIFVEDGE